MSKHLGKAYKDCGYTVTVLICCHPPKPLQNNVHKLVLGEKLRAHLSFPFPIGHNCSTQSV